MLIFFATYVDNFNKDNVENKYNADLVTRSNKSAKYEANNQN